MSEVIKFLGQHADTIFGVIGSGLVFIIGIGFKYAYSHWKLGLFKKYAEMGEHWIETTVLSLTKQYAEEWKKAAADGKLTEEEKKKLKELAVNIVMENLPSKVKKALVYLFGDLKSYVSHRIEAFLLKWQGRK